MSYDSCQNKGDEFVMKKISVLVGKQARVFGDGGWEFSGVIQVDKKDRIVLSLPNSDSILIFKNHISAVLLPAQQVAIAPQKQASTREPEGSGAPFMAFKPAVRRQAQPAVDDLSEGGVSLPHEVLLGVRSEDQSDDNIFSSYFGAATDASGKSRLSVTLEGGDDSE